jgi:hypothetical protein
LRRFPDSPVKPGNDAFINRFVKVAGTLVMSVYDVVKVKLLSKLFLYESLDFRLILIER